MDNRMGATPAAKVRGRGELQKGVDAFWVGENKEACYL